MVRLGRAQVARGDGPRGRGDDVVAPRRVDAERAEGAREPVADAGLRRPREPVRVRRRGRVRVLGAERAERREDVVERGRVRGARRREAVRVARREDAAAADGGGGDGGDGEDGVERLTRYPPAVEQEDAFNLVKFYALDRSLAVSILRATISEKLEYPFVPDETEHLVISLAERRSVLLIGRSGTGKTTCCVFKMFQDFSDYWVRAASGGAWLPAAPPPGAVSYTHLTLPTKA